MVAVRQLPSDLIRAIPFGVDCKWVNSHYITLFAFIAHRQITALIVGSDTASATFPHPSGI